MKSELLFSAAGTIALMLYSCSADDPVAKNTTEGAITYDVIADNQSRAAHSYCNNDKPEEFKIWAIHSEKPSVYYIDGDKIQYNGSSYTDVNGTRYWPESGTLSFYAVVDHDDNDKIEATIDNTNKNSIVVKDYAIKDVDNQLDLMYAVKTDAAYDANIPVSLNFRHALSQICFKARNENPNIQIVINSVTVAGAYGQGTYTLPGTNTDGTYINHDGTTSGQRPDYNGWDPDETSATDYKVACPKTIPYNTTTATDLTCNYNDLTDTNNGTGTPNQWYKKALNLLPQTRGINDGVSFVLNLSIQAKYDGADEYTDTKYKNKNFSVPVDIDWKEGYRYIYTFIFPSNWSPDDNSRIRYDFTFDDFKEETPKEIQIKNHYAVLMRDGADPLYVATTNIGSGTPQEAGLYFWWGDIIGHEAVWNETTNKYETDFEFKDVNALITTNNKNIATLAANGFIEKEGDRHYHLTKEYDAAYQLWGDPWRIPTYEDFEWLMNRDNCKWEQVNKDDKLIGYKVTSVTTKGVIYLPAASCFEGGKELHNIEGYPELCFYWSSNPDQTERNPLKGASRLKAGKNIPQTGYDNIFNLDKGGVRHDGFPIRPVASSTNSTTSGTIPPTTNP